MNLKYVYLLLIALFVLISISNVSAIDYYINDENEVVIENQTIIIDSNQTIEAGEIEFELNNNHIIFDNCNFSITAYEIELKNNVIEIYNSTLFIKTHELELENNDIIKENSTIKIIADEIEIEDDDDDDDDIDSNWKINMKNTGYSFYSILITIFLSLIYVFLNRKSKKHL